MKIPKHIQFIAAGIVAAGLLYLGYSEISKINRRMKTLENNLEIVHQNLETVVRSSNTVLTPTTTNTTTKTSQVVFSEPVATDMTTKSVLEPEHIRVKKDEIERLEKQLENYDSENDITDSDDEYLSDESEYTVSSNDIEDEEVVEETTANTLNKEQNDILETTIDEILAHNATSETTVVSETNEDVVENNEVKPADYSWLVEGIGEDFIPDTLDVKYIKKAYEVTNKEAFETIRILAQKEGIIGGSSSGTLISAALKYCKDQDTKKNVVTFVCDSGEKYLNTAYNKEWLKEKNLI